MRYRKINQVLEKIKTQQKMSFIKQMRCDIFQDLE